MTRKQETIASLRGLGGFLVAALAILLVRVAYLIWGCPYDLVADEAQYWDWSRHLDWSYYSKGPAIAWLIAPSARVFGITEWAVRLPAALAAFACMLLLACFATSVSGGNRRAGWYAMLLFCLAPVYYGTSQFMTTDGPTYACWLGACFTGWIMVRDNRLGAGWFFLLGSLIGIGLLCKYNILLLLPGLLAYFIRHGHFPAGGRRLTALASFFGGLLLFSLPILIWNQQQGWPTVAHLLGATRLPGGDVAAAPDWQYNPLWTLSYPFYAFALLAPPAALLLVRTLRSALKRDPLQEEGSPAGRLHTFTLYALYTSLPILLFYWVVSLRTDVKLNWPAAGFVVLLVTIACHLAERIDSDETTRRLWRWTVGVGVVCALAISLAPYPLKAIGRITIKGKPVNTERLLKRVSGFPKFARSVEAAAREMRRETGREPFYAASTYGRAALLAFYLEGHPAVCSGDSLMGGRESSYDYFDDTSLANPALLGRPAILLDNERWIWERALYFQSIERTRFYGRVYRGYEYRGPSREPHTPPLTTEPRRATRISEAMQDPEHLETLDLFYRRLDSFPLEIGRMNHLRQLILRTCRIGSIPPEIATLAHLETLDLGETSLTNVPPSVAELKNLKQLWMNDNRLTSLPPELGRLDNLVYLNVDRNALARLPDTIGNLRSLKWLRLNGNQLTGLPGTLSGLAQNLETLYLMGNPIPVAERDRIRKALPKCKVVFD
ncbi:MAG: glycosyltransferase family 39 protein [bacterium]